MLKVTRIEQEVTIIVFDASQPLFHFLEVRTGGIVSQMDIKPKQDILGCRQLFLLVENHKFQRPNPTIVQPVQGMRLN